jgi:hypothetical protein
MTTPKQVRVINPFLVQWIYAVKSLMPGYIFWYMRLLKSVD